MFQLYSGSRVSGDSSLLTIPDRRKIATKFPLAASPKNYEVILYTLSSAAAPALVGPLIFNSHVPYLLPLSPSSELDSDSDSEPESESELELLELPDSSSESVTVTYTTLHLFHSGLGPALVVLALKPNALFFFLLIIRDHIRAFFIFRRLIIKNPLFKPIDTLPQGIPAQSLVCLAALILDFTHHLGHPVRRDVDTTSPSDIRL
ncbi:hypothetical protein MUK42_33839 [Musa troglodytarum]|uniref:Uncharacterized protein n=1 Tax=Musa troglodytarum TaxID=320322 RepID=A0A9E7EEA0_9LILI|nr:hypothetical protein MUK42_33839 [Musa troglodytarum]